METFILGLGLGFLAGVELMVLTHKKNKKSIKKNEMNNNIINIPLSGTTQNYTTTNNKTEENESK